MPEPDLTKIAEAYLDAFRQRDLDRCMSYFADDASLDFQGTKFHGREAITEWHKDRFAANLCIEEVESVEIDDDTVTVDLVASSDRLAAWKIKRLNGRITARFDGDKIVEGKLAARMTNLFDLLRSAD